MCSVVYLWHPCCINKAPRRQTEGFEISQAVERQAESFPDKAFIARFPAWILQRVGTLDQFRADGVTRTYNRVGSRGIPSDCSGFRSPRADGRRGTRASRQPQGLRKRLHSVRKAAESLPLEGGEYAYASARVGPDLKVWAVPQHGEDFVRRLGLSKPPNSQNRPRPGLSGISNHGKKQIRWSCQLMEDFRRRTAMWTVTLTDDDYLRLAHTGKWPDFQRRVIDLLVRHLKSHGDEAVVIACVEVGGKRLRRTGRPDPHIHVITTGWGRRGPEGEYILSPDRMDELVAKACQYAGLPSAHRPSASSIGQVRSSVAAYMSKYLTKNGPSDLDGKESEWQELIPRQWWNQSAACKAMVEGVMCKLPPAFAAFLVRKQILLERLEFGRGGVRTVGWKPGKVYDTPIEVYCFRFASPEKLHQAIELFALWAYNSESLDLERGVLSG